MSDATSKALLPFQILLAREEAKRRHPGAEASATINSAAVALLAHLTEPERRCWQKLHARYAAEYEAESPETWAQDLAEARAQYAAKHGSR